MQIDDNTARNWLGEVAAESMKFMDTKPRGGGMVHPEPLAYAFGRMALDKLAYVTDDEVIESHLLYAAAVGLMRAAADALAYMDPIDMDTCKFRVN